MPLTLGRNYEGNSSYHHLIEPTCADARWAHMQICHVLLLTFEIGDGNLSYLQSSFPVLKTECQSSWDWCHTTKRKKEKSKKWLRGITYIWTVPYGKVTKKNLSFLFLKFLQTCWHPEWNYSNLQYLFVIPAFINMLYLCKEWAFVTVTLVYVIIPLTLY